MLVGDFRVTVVRQDDVALVTVERGDETVFRGPLRGPSSFLPLRFDTQGGEVIGLVSANEKNAVLYRDGVLLARTGASPDFRKITARVFGSKTGPDWWDAYTLAWNALIGVFSGAALVFGLFSSTDLGLIGVVAAVVFLVSLAIERSRDKRAVKQLREVLGGG